MHELLHSPGERTFSRTSDSEGDDAFELVKGIAIVIYTGYDCGPRTENLARHVAVPVILA